MAKDNIFWSIGILTIFGLAVFFFVNNSPNNQIVKNEKVQTEVAKNLDIKYITIAGQELKIDLALTEVDKNRGLSGRPVLNKDEGMLFVFEKPGKLSFWMKDMNFPIDIIWIGEDLKVVYIKKNATPASYPDAFQPGENDKDAKYVLEVVAGFSDKYNLKIGDLAEFRY
jgi:uncharacterized membrane protein (UPF0127 family)